MGDIPTMEELEYFMGLPQWAEKYSDGSYQVHNTQLCTRDGRRMGNAVLVHNVLRKGNIPFHSVVVTDAGNVMRMNHAELQEAFYPPQFIMKESEVRKHYEPDTDRD